MDFYPISELDQNFMYIENNKGSGKVVISYDSESILILFLTCTFLPEVQLSKFTRKFHIVFVYLKDSNSVNTGDR